MLKLNRKKKIMLDIKAGDVVNDEEILAEILKNHYVNIVEKSSGVVPIEFWTKLDPNLDRDTTEKLLKHYENHPSTEEIKKLAKTNESFTFPKAKTEDINKIIKSLNPQQTTGPEDIPYRVIKTASKIVDSHLTNVINQDIESNSFSEFAKAASVRPLHKK